MGNMDTEIENNLRMLAQNGLEERKIILFGAGYYSCRMYKILKKAGYDVFAVIDNNKSLDHHKMEDRTVWYAGSFLQEYDDSYIFLILSNYYDVMKAQLEQYGYMEKVHIFKMAELGNRDIWHGTDEIRVEGVLEKAAEGRKLHKQLLEWHGTDIRIMINTTGSIGDVYLLSMYVRKFLAFHSGVLFVVAGDILGELAVELGVGKVVCMSSEEVWSLVFYAKICGLDKTNIELLHTHYGIPFRILGKMLGYAGFIWMEQCRELFGLPQDVKPEAQHIAPGKDIHKMLEKYGLQEGRTVILAPNAKSLPCLDACFWDVLAERLKGAGYSVCTNVASRTESVVKGTVPVEVGIRDIQEFAARAGYFISIRSGLCDLLCDVGCKKIILYSSDVIYGFSLKAMGFDHRVSEYGICEGNRGDVLEEIMREMKGTEGYVMQEQV